MIKVWEPNTEDKELFLRLVPFRRGVILSLVRDGGVVVTDIAKITESGITVYDSVPSYHAARAGLANAIDANGRLKVIGQEVEAVEAEKWSGSMIFESTPFNPKLAIWAARDEGAPGLVFSVGPLTQASPVGRVLSIKDLRALRYRS